MEKIKMNWFEPIRGELALSASTSDEWFGDLTLGGNAIGCRRFHGVSRGEVINSAQIYINKMS